MLELIDRQAAIDNIYDAAESIICAVEEENPEIAEKIIDVRDVILKKIEEQHTVEAEPVRHGHWIWLEPYGALFTHRRKCSECGDIKAQEESNFCPNCGAKMREEGAEQCLK